MAYDKYLLRPDPKFSYMLGITRWHHCGAEVQQTSKSCLHCEVDGHHKIAAATKLLTFLSQALPLTAYFSTGLWITL